MEPGASGKAAGAGAEAEPSFEHQEVGGPAGQQQRPEQHRVAEQHKGQQLPQHLEEVDGEGVRHGSPGSLGLAAPCSSLAQADEGLCFSKFVFLPSFVVQLSLVQGFVPVLIPPWSGSRSRVCV